MSRCGSCRHYDFDPPDGEICDIDGEPTHASEWACDSYEPYELEE